MVAVGPRLYGVGSVVWHIGLVAPWIVGSSQTRDQTHVPCFSRWILNHWTIRDALVDLLLCDFEQPNM